MRNRAEGMSRTCRAASSRRRVGDSIFVWGIWTGLLLYLLAFIVNYGRRFPYCDDWDIILYLSGARPPSLFWLWESDK